MTTLFVFVIVGTPVKVGITMYVLAVTDLSEEKMVSSWTCNAGVGGQILLQFIFIYIFYVQNKPKL